MLAKNILLLLLISVFNSCFALNVSDTSRFVCKQGNCITGQGLVWDRLLNFNIQGQWANGETIAGNSYSLTSPFSPNRQFIQVYGQDGLIEKGEQPRSVFSLGNGNSIPFFKGEYHRINHSFIRRQISILYEGIYDAGNGYLYRGRFEYLAAKNGMNAGIPSGSYIFYGDRIDTVENEIEGGLYVSDETFWNAPVNFVKADPSYLDTLQRKYQKDMEFAIGEFQQQENPNKWRRALAILGKIAVSVATSQLQDSALSSNNLTLNALNLAQGNTISVDPSEILEAGNLTDSLLNRLEQKKTNNIAAKLVIDIFNKKDMNIEDLALYAVNSEIKDPKLNKIITSAIRETSDAPQKSN